MKSPWRRLWRWLAGSFAAVIILLAVVLGLFRLMLPQVPAYHAQIESWASTAVGLPVRLGRLDARWSFGGPELTFKSARLYARETEQVLIEAAEGSVGINLGTLLREGKVSPGKVILSGTRLSLERNAEGILHLTGQTPPAGGAKRAMAPVLQVLPRGSFEFRNAALLYVDHSAGHGPWRFTDVDIAIDHRRKDLLIQGSARLPATLGETAEFKFSTRDDLSDPLAIHWQGSTRLEAVELVGLGGMLPDMLPEIVQGTADLVANFGMIGRHLQHVSVNFVARDFEFVRGPESTEGFAEISGLLEFDREAGGWKAAASNFVLERDGFAWPQSRLTVERTVSSDESVEILYLDAGYLRLDDLHPVIAWLPEGKAQQFFQSLAPVGELHNLVLSRSVRDGEITSFALRGDFIDLALQASESLPGFTGLAGKLRMDDSGGILELDTGPVTLDLPALYTAPVSLATIQSGINWRRTDAGWEVASDALKLAAPAFEFGGRFELMVPVDGSSPTLALDAQFTAMELELAREFLPGNKLPPGAYRWLYGALVSGNAPQTSVSFRGPLRAYPFPNGEGHLRVRTIIEDMRFAFARDWPAIDGARLEAVIENASYRGRLLSGKMVGNDVAGSTASIADFSDPVLIMNGQARGTISDLLAFMRQSPIANVFGPRFNELRSQGGAQTEVVLNMPLTSLEDFRLNGNTALQAEWLGFEGLDQRLMQVDGELNFTETAARASDINASLFGRPVSVDVRPGSDASGAIIATLVEIEGRHSATNLIGNLPFPVATVLEGEADWQATARFPKGNAQEQGMSIELRSSLTGMGVILPEPAFKPAAESQPFAAVFRFPREGEITMDASYGGVLKSATRFSKLAGDWRHERTSIVLGTSPAELPPSEGLVVTGSTDRIALDEWIAVDWGPAEEEEETPLLRSLNLRADRLLAYGQSIADATIKLDRNAREWLAQVNSQRVEGSFLIPADLDGDQPIFADLVRLVLLPEADDAEPETSDPRDLPAMRLTAAEFIYDDMNFGSLEALVSRSPYGLVADTIKTRDPGFSIDATGRWEILEGRESSSLDFELQASNVLRTLVQLGFDPFLRADDATVSGSLQWPGPPDRNFRKQLYGSVQVRVGDGQLLEVEPGAGRMFGLLSIAALPRRLSLDFRDVFDTGFGFDSISGDFEIADGQAYTENLVLDGPAADIGVAGRAGLAERDYDQTAVVRANFGSALPVAGAIAGGPAVGAALLIFSEILKDPLKDMSKVFYRVTGSWDNPEISRVTQAVAEAPGTGEAPPPMPPESEGG